MASYKEFFGQDVNVRFFPEEKSLVLLPVGKDKSVVEKLKSKMHTLLRVNNSSVSPQGSVTLKLDQDDSSDIYEFLHALGFKGGLTQDKEAASDNAVDKSPSVSPQPPPQNEQINFNILELLNESTYRSAEYWNDLERVVGKNKRIISEKDILNVRAIYTEKPKSQHRDRILRALDRAYRYFLRRIRKDLGTDAMEIFRQKYKSIGDLDATEYAISEKEKREKLQQPSVSSVLKGFEPLISYFKK